MTMIGSAWAFSKFKHLYRVRPLKPKDLEKYLEKETILIDVRTPQEYELDTLESSLHVPLQQIAAFQGDRKKQYLTFCNSGIRSYKAAETLYDQGYKKCAYLAAHYDVLKKLLAEKAQSKD